jgi:glycosyltransferase involved in cell wall biosynthesis
MERPSWDFIWSSFASTIAQRSMDPNFKVGAVIVPEDNTGVLALGYNGDHKGGPNQRVSEEPGQSGFIHAEINALIKLDYNNPKKKIYDFIYPANLMPHKNHNNLFKAFILLSKKGIRPSLALTLNTDELKSVKYNLLKKKINLNNLYNQNRKIFLNNFSKCKYLIYPSLNENIGLPLVEAHYLGLEIIASKLDFAKQYDFIDYFFNPLSPKDIASSVVRFLNKNKTKKSKSYYNYNNNYIPFNEYF